MARDTSKDRFAAQNRKARHDFFIEDTLDAGMVLTGTEVKSLRLGRVSINEAFAVEKDGCTTPIFRNTNPPTASTTSPGARANFCSRAARSRSCTARPSARA
jgi:hypothetical protein